ncbi:unnamed protein product [Clonostachys solani]|uniref:Xylanolytic transcriptional activator regulatory domain-containing protein n=1 Tax=Clonostachys solani TaxID=160281 RepID=A0A9P0EJJ5_9HYPO|nr:unnamed protein product [Clonostachys solani]
MASQAPPELPAPLSGLVKYIHEHPELPVSQILGPYHKYEAYFRALFAQDGQNPILDNPYINILLLFTEVTGLVTTRARNLALETAEERSRYIMPLPDEKRRKDGSPAIVASLAEFQRNFSIFSEASLAEMDWSNVVAAGSSVFHEVFCPASDVDLFLYGLTEEEAIEKIKAIEEAVRDTLLKDVTVVRTKYAITIASHYPTRHIQIVLRVYKSISEILTGFDIDAAGGAYDGKQVYVTPRALASFITQVNHIDLTRRSPSYETRLAKYSNRSFEVYWSDLDRSRIDPTIYERSFKRTVGLARLLVLESLPTESARHTYKNERRRERGRPELSYPHLNWRDRGNMKQDHENEVADWFPSEEVSNYHTFSIPYGRRFTAKAIERLFYSHDMLLNAEWNQKSEERKVYLHRHPVFFGRVEDVIQDCCGCCPVPNTVEEQEMAENEAKMYISGKVSFLTDDPGRQAIGSFNPLTEQDWTEMAYIGNTARLFQSIIDGDIQSIHIWLGQDGFDVNRRDHTGRAPLHFAVNVSTAEIVQCLVDHGARLTARLADGRTALHLAAARGRVDMIKVLMEKSLENEEIGQDRKKFKRRKIEIADQEVREDTSEGEMHNTRGDLDMEQDEDGSDAVVVGEGENETEMKEASETGPDFYDIDIPAWDIPCSPLHLAVSGGHEDAVRTLCDYGADPLLLVQFRLNRLNRDVILTLALALKLPIEKAKSMIRLLIELGALSSQTDTDGITAFHHFVASNSGDLLDVLVACDRPNVTRALKHIYIPDRRAISVLHTAIDHDDPNLLLTLLNIGVKPDISFDMWLRAVKLSPMKQDLGTMRENKRLYRTTIQPLLYAVQVKNYQAATQLLEFGADPNSMTPDSYSLLQGDAVYDLETGSTVLDVLDAKLLKIEGSLDSFKRNQGSLASPNPPRTDEFLEQFPSGSYQHFYQRQVLERQKWRFESDLGDQRDKQEMAVDQVPPNPEIQRLEKLASGLNYLKEKLVSRGGQTFKDLHTDFKEYRTGRRGFRLNSPSPSGRPSSVESGKICFRGDKNFSSSQEDEYIELMEAAWDGDLDKIKSLTLRTDPDDDRPRLLISIEDDEHNCPFSLAFFRGHHEVAAAILDIVRSQWAPKEDSNQISRRPQLRRRTRSPSCRGSSSPGRSEMELDSGDDVSQLGPIILSEDEDNVSVNEDLDREPELSTSDKTPMRILRQEWQTLHILDTKWEPGARRTLFESSVWRDDVAGLEFLIKLARYWTSQKLPDDPVEELVLYRDDTDKKEQDGIFTLSEAEFQTVLNQGNPEIVHLVMREIGAGLTVEDWANIVAPGDRRRPRGRRLDHSKKDPHTNDVGVAPVIYAVRSGQVEIVKLFLSETPLQLYAEFARSDAASDNPKILHLLQSKAGFDLTASEWLGASNHLLLHHALLTPTLQQAEEVLKYLIQRFPDAVESRDSTGHTPLLIAARIGRISLVEILIRDGHADQTVCNSKGENILHLALEGPVESRRFCELTKIIDAGLLGDLFRQRKKLWANGTVPLHSWIAHICGYPSRDDDTDIFSVYGTYTPLRDRPADLVSLLQTLLEFSNDKALESFNDVGDTCLHTAIKSRQLAIVRGLIQYNPGLVCRENAMGQTPLELANELVIRATIKPPKPLMLKADYDYEDRYIIGRTWWTDPVPGTKVKPPPAQHMPNTSIEERLAKLGLSDDYSESVVSETFYRAGLCGNERMETSSDMNAILAKKITLDFCKTSVQKNPGLSRVLASVVAANDVARRVAELNSSSRDTDEEHTSMADAKLHRDIDLWDDPDGEDEYDEDCIVVPHLRERLRSRGRMASSQSDSQLCNVPGIGHWSLSSVSEDLYNMGKLEDMEIDEEDNLHIGYEDGLRFDLPPFLQPFPANISAGDFQYLQLKGVLALPPLTVQDAFIDAYIKHVQPRFHLISITDLYRMVNHRNETGPALSLLLYHAVLYAAAAFVDLHFIQNAGYASRRVARKHLYDKTRLLYNFGYEKDHLVVVQSLLLLAGWYQTPSEHKDSWHWVGLAISTAQSIGLDKNQTEQMETSIARTNLGRRVWWSCLMHGRLIALGLRYPSRLKEEDYNVDMLHETDFDIDGLVEHGTARSSFLAQYIKQLPQLASICIARAKLCVLIGEVLYEQYFILPCHDRAPDTTKRSILLSPRKKFDNFDSAGLIYLDLCNWKRELPYSCYSNGQLKPAAGAEKTPASLQGILLQMEFYTAVSALFRPYITQTFDNNTNLSMQDQKSCGNRVRDAATEVTKLLTDLERSDLYRYMPSTGVSITFSAAVVHLADVVGPPSFNHGKALACFQLCMAVLDHLREIYAEADYASNYLSNMSKSATRSAYIA